MSDTLGYGHRTRREHVAWAKERALEFLDRGHLAGAFDSLISDLNKHDEARGHLAIDLGGRLLLGAHLSRREKMRDFIEGVN